MIYVTTQGMSGIGSNGNESVLHTLQVSRDQH